MAPASSPHCRSPVAGHERDQANPCPHRADHPIFRKRVRALVNVAPDLEITGEADTGDAAVDLVSSTPPDVVLMDLQIPKLNDRGDDELST